MKSIRIQNLRCLSDTKEIELRPITLLLGENSSGKSTFLRSLPLLRQSVDIRSTGPILWFGKFVDFGSFNEAVNAFASDKQITFEFNLGKVRFRRRYSGQQSLFDLSDEYLNLSIKLKIVGDSKGDAFTNYCQVNFEDNVIELGFDTSGEVTLFTVNSRDFKNKFSNLKAFHAGELIPHVYTLDNSELGSTTRVRYIRPDFEEDVLSTMREYVHPKTGDDKLKMIIRRIDLGSSQEMLKKMQQIPSSFAPSWSSRIEKWSTDNMEFITLKNILIAAYTFQLLNICEEELDNFSRNTKYIAPLRATAERYYRLQNLAVDEVDFQGQNLAMFLRNLSDTERKKFSEWTEDLFGFSPQASSAGGHVSIMVNQGEHYKFNLTDMGFGFSQVLPILTQLWQLGQKNLTRSIRMTSAPLTFAIEQPELHLHPRMQAKLGEAFSSILKQAELSKIDLRLIIETHSEALVNSIGRLVSKKEIAPNDVNVVIFEKLSPDGPTEVKFSGYDEKGYLINWPYGFFEPDMG